MDWTPLKHAAIAVAALASALLHLGLTPNPG